MKIKWQEDEWVQRRIETAVGKVQTPDEVGEVADGAVVGNGTRSSVRLPKLVGFSTRTCCFVTYKVVHTTAVTQDT